jgi:hypothetical protein
MQDWMPIFIFVILGGKLLNCSNSDLTKISCEVVMIFRLHAMYQGSRKILVFLVAILLVLTIATGVLLGIVESYLQWGEL